MRPLSKNAIRRRVFAYEMAKSWRAAVQHPEQTLNKDTGYTTPSFMANLTAAFTDPFSKHPYNPSFGSVPSLLEPQVNRAVERAGDSPNEVQEQLNTSTARQVGTSTVAAGPEPVGFGGGGSTGSASRQLGHAAVAGNEVLAAPEAQQTAPATQQAAPMAQQAPAVAVQPAAGTAQPATPQGAPQTAPASISAMSGIAPGLLPQQ